MIIPIASQMRARDEISTSRTVTTIEGGPGAEAAEDREERELAPTYTKRRRAAPGPFGLGLVR